MINDKAMFDSNLGQVAKHTTTEKKINDKLKSTIASNIKSNASLIKIPIIQIAGFSGKLSVLTIPKKKEYHLEDVCSFGILKSLQSGLFEHLIDSLFIIDVS